MQIRTFGFTHSHLFALEDEKKAEPAGPAL